MFGDEKCILNFGRIPERSKLLERPRCKRNGTVKMYSGLPFNRRKRGMSGGVVNRKNYSRRVKLRKKLSSRILRRVV